MKIVVAVLTLVFMTAPIALAPQEIDQMTSVWEGVFTEAQANRGQAVYDGACGFLICAQRRRWHGRSSCANGRGDRLRYCSSTPARRCQKTIRVL